MTHRASLPRLCGPLLGGLALVGCGQIPNPNDLTMIRAEERPAAAQRILASAKEYYEGQVAKGALTDEARNAALATEMDRLLNTIDPARIRPQDQWIYGDLLRSTGRTEEAAAALKKAVATAPDWDRRVNDTLRYAVCLAKLGRIPQAIATERTILQAPETERAPILLATLYELVPAAENQGHDPELADLLTDAIACHLTTRVDRRSPEGKAFLVAVRYHVARAERKIATLRRSNAGRPGTVRA